MSTAPNMAPLSIDPLLPPQMAAASREMVVQTAAQPTLWHTLSPASSPAT